MEPTPSSVRSSIITSAFPALLRPLAIILLRCNSAIRLYTQRTGAPSSQISRKVYTSRRPRTVKKRTRRDSPRQRQNGSASVSTTKKQDKVRQAQKESEPYSPGTCAEPTLARTPALDSARTSSPPRLSALSLSRLPPPASQTTSRHSSFSWWIEAFSFVLLPTPFTGLALSSVSPTRKPS